MNIKNPTGTVFYLIEQSIKDYRKFSQKNINKIIDDITVDQCLVLMILDEKITSSQKEIAQLIYKDYASITRMVELMVNKNYLERSINPSDRRRFNLKISSKGKKALEILSPRIKENREIALNGLTNEEVDQLEIILKKIISNCNTK